MVAILTSLLWCYIGQACLTQLSVTNFPAKSTVERPLPWALLAHLVAMRPILFPWYSVNQRLPSGPAVMAIRVLPAVGTENAVIAPGRDGVVPPPAGWLRMRASVMPLATMTTRPASAMRGHLGADPIIRLEA